MIERKSWRDLAASILDNRYKEQHARYKDWARENGCNVWYIIEGPKRFRTPSQEKRTLSAHISLCFDMYTNVVETKGVNETMEWIHRVVQKMHTRGYGWCQSGFKQSNREMEETGRDGIISQCDIELAQQKVNQTGKKQHSLSGTWIAMLSCMYGMSIEKATAIISHFKKPENFIQKLRAGTEKELIQELQSIVVKRVPKQRKLGKVLAKRLVDVFCVNIVKEQT